MFPTEEERKSRTFTTGVRNKIIGGQGNHEMKKRDIRLKPDPKDVRKKRLVRNIRQNIFAKEIDPPSDE